MTIAEAIISILKTVGQPLSYQEIYQKIIEQKLYEFGAKNPAQLVNNKIRKHCVDLNFPSASPVKYFTITSNNSKPTQYYLKESGSEKSDKSKSSSHINEPLLSKDLEESTAEERVQNAYFEHRQNTKQLLLEQILESDFAFFEQLVVDLLLKMGYGGGLPDAGLVTKRTGDEGIDGIIKEDKLGLNKIFIQAKRNATKTVGRPEIQQFIGAMEAVTNGVFITTSKFSKQAQDFAERSHKSLVLIDGETLAEYMINCGVGVSIVKQYSIFKIDSNYFYDP